MGKKGELTTQQLITIIILIVSFSVILFFIFRLNFSGQVSNKDLCRNSILLAANSLNPISSSTPLDCKTSYVCISGGEKCREFSETSTIKIDLTKKEEIKNQTLGAIADEMADCWWMFGEGKMDFIPFDTQFQSYHCGACSIIKFSPDVQKANPDGISYAQIYEYLEKTKFDGYKTYLEYIYNVKDLATLKSKLLSVTYSGSVETKLFNEPFDLARKYNIMIMSEYEYGKNNDKFPGVYPVLPEELSGANKKLTCAAFDIIRA